MSVDTGPRPTPTPGPRNWTHPHDGILALRGPDADVSSCWDNRKIFEEISQGDCLGGRTLSISVPFHTSPKALHVTPNCRSPPNNTSPRYLVNEGRDVGTRSPGSHGTSPVLSVKWLWGRMRNRLCGRCGVVGGVDRRTIGG